MTNKTPPPPKAAPARPKRKVRRRAGRPPASRRAFESKQEILDAALRAFGEAGFQEMSVRKLAQSLGVSHNLISHYFRSKEELWQACVDYSVGEINRELIALAEAATPETDVVEILRAICVHFLHLAARFPANLFIITQEGASGGRRLDYLYERLMEPAQRTWNALLDRAVAEKKIRRVDPRTTFFLLTHGGASMFSMLPLAQRMGGPHPLDPDFLDTHARDVADILIRGIMLNPPPPLSAAAASAAPRERS